MQENCIPRALAEQQRRPEAFFFQEWKVDYSKTPDIVRVIACQLMKTRSGNQIKYDGVCTFKDHNSSGTGPLEHELPRLHICPRHRIHIFTE